MLSSMLWELLPTIILISEILKRNRCAIEKSVESSTVDTKESKEGRGTPKCGGIRYCKQPSVLCFTTYCGCFY